MKIKQIALAAAKLLRLDDVASAMDSQTADGEDIARLCFAAVSAVREYACDFPLVHSAGVSSIGGKISFTSIVTDGKIKSIVGVKQGGKSAAYSLTESGIELADGSYDVYYTLIQPQCALDGEAEVSDNADEIVLGYLTARNFCLSAGRTDEAEVWDEMYRSAVEKVRLGRRARISVRRFIV